MSNNLFNENPSKYEGDLFWKNQDLKDLVEELLFFINRNGLDFDNEEDIKKLLIKTEIQYPHE